MIFETHAHYDDKQFEQDRESLLEAVQAAGVGRIINVSSSIESVSKTLQIAAMHEQVYAAVGVHPSDISGLNGESFRWLRDQADKEKVAAIGEIGLDYHWDKEDFAQKAQREWFVRQLSLAEEVELPVIIHSRDAAEDTMNILTEVCQRGVKGVIHCYSYSPEMAEEYVKMGFYIGVGGVVTFKNAKKLKETVRRIPLERILLETDCPYMAPEPYRGTRNHSGLLSYVRDQIGQLKGISSKNVEKATEENARRLFTRIN